MPFIGTQPDVGGYSVLDNLTASATASYTLQKDSANFVPSSANQLLVSLNGVIQKPGTSFTVSGSTLTFSSALTSSDSIDFILAMGEPLLVGTPSDGAVNTTQLATNAVSSAKIASSAVTDAKIAGMAATKLTGTLPVARFPTGTVLQVKGDSETTAVTNSINGYTDSGLSVSITPSSSTNYFLVVFEGHFSSQNASNDKGFGMNIYKNGTAVTTSPNDGFNAPYDWYQDDSGNGERYFLRSGKTYYAQTGTTSAVTFTVSFTGYSYSTGGDVVLGYDNETQRTLIVYEIQG